jgi:hypothetical protein
MLLVEVGKELNFLETRGKEGNGILDAAAQRPWREER